MKRRTAMYDIYTICRILIQFLKIIDKNNLSNNRKNSTICLVLQGIAAAASISTLALSSIKALTLTTDMTKECHSTSSLYFCPNDFKEDNILFP